MKRVDIIAETKEKLFQSDCKIEKDSYFVFHYFISGK